MLSLLSDYTKNALISSYKTNTKAPPVPRNTLESAPLKNALDPSVLAILPQQWIVFLYMRSFLVRPDCIIILRRTVSNG